MHRFYIAWTDRCISNTTVFINQNVLMQCTPFQFAKAHEFHSSTDDSLRRPQDIRLQKMHNALREWWS